MTTVYTTMSSPVGELLLVGDGTALTQLRLPTEHAVAPPAGGRADRAALRTAVEQLDAYFGGELSEFDLPLAPTGTTFQLRVWSALRDIPYGRTASYRDIATRVGNAQACRAVGLANGRNPIPVIVPCHRVIGADGSLTGYGGGLPIKRWLLEHERRQADLLATVGTPG